MKKNFGLKRKRRKEKFFRSFWSSLTVLQQEQIYQWWVRQTDINMTIAHTLKNEDFYNSKEWRETRYKFLAGVADKKCCVCMARDNIEIHVDHIKPRWLYPELAFDHRNLRILCAPCNLGKYTDVPLSNKPLKKVILRKQNELLDLKTGDK